MLLQLSIKNIILVDHVVLAFNSGFSVLTGETGAGKSIILEALSFVLGRKAAKSLVCNDAEYGEVIAKFDISSYPKLKQIYNSDELVLRRRQNKDGRSKCFLGDKSISLADIASLGADLVEFHGQHADRLLLKKSEHLTLLDNFAKLGDVKEKVAIAYSEWQKSKSSLQEKRIYLSALAQEQDYLKNAAIELADLAAQEGEEEKLSTKRAEMLSNQKIAGIVKDTLYALEASPSPSSILSDLWRRLERNAEKSGQYTQTIIAQLDNILNNLALLEEQVQDAVKILQIDEGELEKTEERLFALRAAARKYNMLPSDLVALQQQIYDKLKLIENAEQELADAEKQLDACEAKYLLEAEELSKLRSCAASVLAQEVMQTLPDLKLEHAKFFVKFVSDINNAHNTGIDTAEFWVQTNPNTKAGPILEVASGGELSRFLLALRIVLSHKNMVPTLILDEVDTGVSGAVAASIGSKLQKLAKQVQIIAISHLPQVAAKANSQFLIRKELSLAEDRLVTKIKKLNENERLEEIARMLSGSEITEEARASAKSLLYI